MLRMVRSRPLLEPLGRSLTAVLPVSGVPGLFLWKLLVQARIVNHLFEPVYLLF